MPPDRPGKPRLAAVAFAAAVTALALSTLPATVTAATPWQISASPTTLRQGQATLVRLTVTAGNPPIGTLGVTIPTGYLIVGAAVVSTPSGTAWTAAVASASLVTFQTATDPQRLKDGDIAVFGITVVPTTAAGTAWTAAAYQKWTIKAASCGPPAPQLGRFTIVAAATPTPAVTTATTTSPPPVPTASPTRTASGPTSTATATGTTGAWSTETASASPSADPGSSPGASSSGSPEASRSPVAAGPASDTGHQFGRGSEVVIPALPAGATVGISGLDGMGLYSWLVPGFLLGLPGLLILLVALLQAGAGGALLPVARRVLGDFGIRRSRARIRPS
jgi:hypothetical protein